MTFVDHAPKTGAPPSAPGPLGRLGDWTASHFRTALAGWVIVVAVLGVFAPQVTTALSGAGWQSNGSESVAVRELAQQHFGGTGSTAIQVVVHADRPVTDPAVQTVLAKATKLLTADDRISEVVQPRAGATISRDGATNGSPARRAHHATAPSTVGSAQPTN
ncbi:hypothetical protein ABTY96_29380 [Streptomyces sp. NPDC096057]|uniref:hypothetical protein n=1 Tax=Streptomyces sp. NPDC096057 TaxID=3155543 RepID=UPI003321A949